MTKKQWVGFVFGLLSLSLRDSMANPQGIQELKEGQAAIKAAAATLERSGPLGRWYSLWVKTKGKSPILMDQSFIDYGNARRAMVRWKNLPWTQRMAVKGLESLCQSLETLSIEGEVEAAKAQVNLAWQLTQALKEGLTEHDVGMATLDHVEDEITRLDWALSSQKKTSKLRFAPSLWDSLVWLADEFQARSQKQLDALQRGFDALDRSILAQTSIAFTTMTLGFGCFELVTMEIEENGHMRFLNKCTGNIVLYPEDL